MDALMHVAVTGSTGFIGSALIPHLRRHGHTVTRLVRGAPGAPDERSWDPGAGELDPDQLSDVDAAVHLAGEPITERRWTRRQKARIRRSRSAGTGLLASALANHTDGPRILVSASGIHYYGDRGDEVLTEDSAPGKGFLAEVVADWEEAADPARAAGVRVVHLRFGLIQSPEGGMLPRLLPLFRVGLGGPLGRGRQYWSWVGLDDVVGLIAHALEDDELRGPVNVTAPDPVTNAEFARTLARVLGRPALLPVPPFGPALLLGRELASELLFTSARVLPERALAAGYRFRHTNLEPCFRDLLERPAPTGR